MSHFLNVPQGVCFRCSGLEIYQAAPHAADLKDRVEATVSFVQCAYGSGAAGVSLSVPSAILCGPWRHKHVPGSEQKHEKGIFCIPITASRRVSRRNQTNPDVESVRKA